MPDRAIFIRGMGDYYAPVAETPPELGPLVKEALGAQVRRIGRFVQLALIGAARCLSGRSPPAETGVYLTSGRGDMEVTIDVMTQLYRDGVTPRPLSFINTVSNSACFYVAKQFALKGRSTFVCNRYFSFESALHLAMLDFELGLTRSALVGAVDIALAPLEVHRRRLRLPADAPVAEGSHWLWLEAGDASEPGPRITSMEMLANDAALQRWMQSHASEPSATMLAFGQFIDFEEAIRIIAWPHPLQTKVPAIQTTVVLEYRDGRAYYDSQSAAAISDFLAKRPAGISTLLHINRDAEGRFAVFAAKAS